MGSDPQTLAVSELAAVLHELGVDARLPDRPDRGWDLALPGGSRLAIKSASRPTLDHLHRLDAQYEGRPGVTPVLLADQLSPGVRRALGERGWGWLDRTGHIHLMVGSIQLDRPIPSLTGPNPKPPRPLSRPTALAVVLELLDGEPPRTVRGLARRAGVSVGAAHSAVDELARAGLLQDFTRRDPDLFWSVVEEWRVRWFALAAPPDPEVSETIRGLLRMRRDRLDEPGWATVGDAAVRAMGVRVPGDTPSRLYLPDQRALTWALRTWGTPDDDRFAKAFVGVPPTINATARRQSPANAARWPVARPIAIALHLASDPDPRSRQFLEAWRPEVVNTDVS